MKNRPKVTLPSDEALNEVAEIARKVLTRPGDELTGVFMLSTALTPDDQLYMQAVMWPPRREQRRSARSCVASWPAVLAGKVARTGRTSMPRRPVPVEIAKRRGNPGKRALPQPIRFAPLEAVPEPPADLGPVEQEAWTQVAEPLAEAGALQSIHLPLLRQFAVAVGMAERAAQSSRKGSSASPAAGGRS